MKLELHYMSTAEVQFIKLYALTLKKHYSVFSACLQLMRTEVGIRCPARAATLATQLQEMQADFDHALASLANRHKPRARDLPSIPTTDDLVQLLQISFFKLVQPDEQKGDNFGWFSGHPLDWENAWKKSQSVPTEPSPALTTIMSAFLKLLGNKLQSDFKLFHVPGFPFKKLPPFTADMHEDYEAYDDEDDDDNDPDYRDED